MTPNLRSQIETILFVASKPLSYKRIAKVLSAGDGEVLGELEALRNKYSIENSGIVLLTTGEEWQLVSQPDNGVAAEHFVKAEVGGDLTRPQLETLTVISYCGPITKPELEQIRGVNCSLILRNLLIRGLVKEAETGSSLLPSYEVTMEYLQHLGISSLKELPDYDTLHEHEFITKTLEQK